MKKVILIPIRPASWWHTCPIQSWQMAGLRKGRGSASAYYLSDKPHCSRKNTQVHIHTHRHIHLPTRSHIHSYWYPDTHVHLHQHTCTHTDTSTHAQTCHTHIPTSILELTHGFTLYTHTLSVHTFTLTCTHTHKAATFTCHTAFQGLHLCGSSIYAYKPFNPPPICLVSFITVQL